MMRGILTIAMALLSVPAVTQAQAPSPPAPICAFGADPASDRQEAFCAAQVALRSSVARSFSLLAARMATSDEALGATLRRMQDADARVDLLARLERSARADGMAAPALATARARLDAAIAERSAARTALESGFPRWVALTQPRPIGEGETQALLRPGETLIFWLVGDDATFAFAIQPTAATWERIPLGRAALERAVLGLRDALGVTGPVRGARALSANVDATAARRHGRSLYTQLFPGSVGVAARRARIVAGAIGAADRPSFAALPTAPGRDPEWLGLAKPLALLPSPADLRTWRGRPAVAEGATSFAGFGAPLLTGGGSSGSVIARAGTIGAALAELPPLPESEGELRALAAALGASPDSVHVGAGATERAVKAADLSATRIIAFATHGLIAGEVAGVGEAGLVLTPPAIADETDDGLLTASEAAQLRLDADWVLLSACSTAAGDRVGGEALSGLAAAFGYAGARALLVSHWQVRDDAARRLTTLAITNRALGRGEALRRAMVAVATDRQMPAWHDPSVWAVMTLIGDPAR